MVSRSESQFNLRFEIGFWSAAFLLWIIFFKNRIGIRSNCGKAINWLGAKLMKMMTTSTGYRMVLFFFSDFSLFRSIPSTIVSIWWFADWRNSYGFIKRVADVDGQWTSSCRHLSNAKMRLSEQERRAKERRAFTFVPLKWSPNGLNLMISCFVKNNECDSPCTMCSQM